jgi:hypothetical protein
MGASYRFAVMTTSSATVIDGNSDSDAMSVKRFIEVPFVIHVG